MIFVLADTLRRDRLGIHGGLARTPAFDRFARTGVLFRRATAQSPWTKPSIATLFTGLHPGQHGVLSHPSMRRGEGALESDVLPEEPVTLAEALEAGGYETAAFVSNPWLQRKLGFAQGFAHWDESFAANDAPGVRISRAGLKWLRERSSDEPFFLYLHYMDPHAPYQPVPEAALRERLDTIRAEDRPLPRRARRRIARLARDKEGRALVRRGVPANPALMELVYDQGVEEFDRALALLLEGLETQGLADEVAVVVTSDHGEALFTRGWRGHGYALFEDEIAVPLAARLPGVGPREYACPVGLIDLRRSLCQYLDVECPGPDFGRSFFRDGGAPRRVHAAGVKGKPRHRALREGDLKLIYQPGGPPRGASVPDAPYLLYDLAAEGGEAESLHDDPEYQEELERLRPRLEEGVPKVDLEGAETVPLDEATRKRLEALGYLGED